MLASNLIDRAARELVDISSVRWTRKELLRYLGEGVNTIAVRQPGLVATSKTVSVTASPISIPEDAFELLDVEDINGVSPQYVLINKLTQLYPRWKKETGVPACWTKFEHDSKRFWIYPQPASSVDVVILYAKSLSLETEESEIPIPDIYEAPLIDYVMYRAYSRDGQNQSESAKAQMHIQAFAIFMNDEKLIKDERKLKLDQGAFK
ncbi:TPA: DUF6682 family protein [Photobacterium damselae]